MHVAEGEGLKSWMLLFFFFFTSVASSTLNLLSTSVYYQSKYNVEHIYLNNIKLAERKDRV